MLQFFRGAQKKTGSYAPHSGSGRGSGIIFLAVAVMAGLLAAAIALQMITAHAPTSEVAVAVREIMPGEQIKPEDLTVRRLPAAGINTDAIRTVEEAVGKHARTIILKASVLRPGMIAELAGGTGTIPAMAGPNLRAVPLPLDIFLGAHPARGDRVDVIAVTTPAESKNPGVALTVVKEGEVLRVSLSPDVGGKEGYVLVRATPKEAELLALAQAFGRVYGTIAGLDTEAEEEAPVVPSASSLLELWETARPTR